MSVQQVCSWDVPDDAAKKLSQTIEAVARVEPVSRSFFGNRVWRIRAKTGTYYLKFIANPWWYEAELFAYHHFDAVKEYLPALVEVYDTFQGVLVKALEGVPLEHIDVEKTHACQIWQDAGQLTRRIHESLESSSFGIPNQNGQPAFFVHTAPIDYVAAITKHLKDNLTRHYACSPEEQTLLDWLFFMLDIYAGEKPVCVNPDDTPGNWLINQQHKLVGVIDFERVHWGVRSDAFAHLLSKYALPDGDFIDAYFKGYGRNLLVEAPLQLRHSLIRHGFFTLLLGIQNRSEKHIHRGKALLHRLYLEGHDHG